MCLQVAADRFRPYAKGISYCAPGLSGSVHSLGGFDALGERASGPAGHTGLIPATSRATAQESK